LFTTFLLKPLGLTDRGEVNGLVTALLAGIAIVGFWRGFRAVEGVEVYAVSAKLAVIAGLIAGLAVFDLAGPPAETAGALTSVPGHFAWRDLPVLLGLLILVQGFETSRFLGHVYGPGLRIRTMKLAQLLSAAIYVGFFVLMTPLLGVDAGDQGAAAIVDMLRPAALVLPLLVLGGALASQSSAAIADTLGASGLLHDLSARRIAVRQTYPLIAMIAALVTWSTNVYSLITLASRFFALYYLLQCAVAAMSALRRGRVALAAGFAALALVCAAVTVLGTPAEGG